MGAPRVAPRVVSPRVAPRVVSPRIAPRVVAPRVAPPMGGPRVGPPSGVRVVGPRPGITGPRLGARMGSSIVVRGRPLTLVRTGPYYRFWRGRRYSFVPLAAIAVLTIGAITYSAYAYVPVDDPGYCVGYTADGCELRWQEVMTVEGDAIPQCVSFCPIP